MADVTLTRGLPASGKSTWAKRQVDANPGGVKRVNKDDLRSMLDNGQWSRQNERFVLQVRDTIVRAALARDTDVIVDDTNLSPKHEAHFRRVVAAINERHGTDHRVTVRDFTDVSLDTCIARDRQRPEPVGERVIRGMYNQFLKPSVDPETAMSSEHPDGHHAAAEHGRPPGPPK